MLEDTVKAIQGKVESTGGSIVLMIGALAGYATAYEKQVGCKIGEDKVIGEYWLEIAKALRRLLNGPTLDLRCGEADILICKIIVAAGFDESETK